MTMHNNIGGVWKQVSDPECNIGGVWKKIQEGWCNIAGVWKKFFSRLFAIYTNGVENFSTWAVTVASSTGSTFTKYSTYMESVCASSLTKNVGEISKASDRNG
jgi:hypothetical protein